LRAAVDLEEELPAITGREVGAIVRAMPQKATRWADGWTIPELRHLQEDAFDGLAAVLNEIESCRTLPEQARLAVVGLIPKPAPSVGDRPICVFSFLYQLWGAVRNHLAAD
jgi:hypothetical protein